MGYLLGHLVTVWMGLYHDFPRLARWSKGVGRMPTVQEAIDFLETQRFPTGGKAAYWRTNRALKVLSANECRKSLRVLESAWSRACTTPPVRTTEPTEVCSLIDFPRFYGASWPHNDVAVYVPGSGAAVMKISDDRFNPLRERLSRASGGLDPFIGTKFKLTHTKIYSSFGRIRCSKGDPIALETFQSLGSFRELDEFCRGGYSAPKTVARLLSGSEPLDLTSCVIARYSNHYALMKFILTDAKVANVQRLPDSNLMFELELDGHESRGWMFRNSIYDSRLDPARLGGREVRLAAFAVLGKSSLQDYGMIGVHALTVRPLEPTESLPAPSYGANNLPSIAEIEEELSERLYPAGPPVELQTPPVAPAPPQPVRPTMSIIREADFSPLAGRALGVVFFDRTRTVSTEEVLYTLKQAWFPNLTRRELVEELTKLSSGELIYQSVFGGSWFANPKFKFIAQSKDLPVKTLEAAIVQFLKRVYPQRISIRRIYSEFGGGTWPSVQIRNIGLAIRNLSKERRINVSSSRKMAWNPYPPKSWAKGRSAEQKIAQTYLTEEEVRSLPVVCLAHKSRVVHLRRANGQFKTIWVNTPGESMQVLSSCIAELFAGRLWSIKYTDHLGGRISVEVGQNGEITAIYSNRNSSAFEEIVTRLRESV